MRLRRRMYRGDRPITRLLMSWLFYMLWSENGFCTNCLHQNGGQKCWTNAKIDLCLQMTLSNAFFVIHFISFWLQIHVLLRVKGDESILVRLIFSCLTAQANLWTNIDLDLWCHMTCLSHSDKIDIMPLSNIRSFMLFHLQYGIHLTKYTAAIWKPHREIYYVL